MTMQTRDHSETIGQIATRTRVTFGLDKIAGNERAHFSVTCDQWKRGRHESAGCQHALVLSIWPDLAPLVALHLSDSDGAPLHAEANGYYWLSGACGGLGERYHGGNSAGPGAPTAEECLQIFANHCRITLHHARSVVSLVQSAGPASINWNTPRKAWVGICEEMRPRWKAEANEAIRVFNLA